MFRDFFILYIVGRKIIYTKLHFTLDKNQKRNTIYIEINNKQEGGIHYDERGKANGYGKQARCHAK